MELKEAMTEEERKKFDVVEDLKIAVFNLRTEIESKNKKHAALVKMASKNLAQLAKQASRITELGLKIKFLEKTIRQREANLNVTEQRNRELEAENKRLKTKEPL